MTVLYCTEADLKDYILEAYLDKLEEINPGICSRTLENVSAEILEAIHQGGHTIPETGYSAILKRICAVMTAYRCVGDITTLMDTEASSGNEWIPLQRLFEKSEKHLDKIREGKLDPYPASANGDTGISVSAPDAMFGPSTWEKF
jgi:hypothetical protein